ncbi:phage protein [Streptococcus pseudoporcinus]|nr:phage protein [Streptococcus pseudoporcinus]
MQELNLTPMEYLITLLALLLLMVILSRFKSHTVVYIEDDNHTQIRPVGTRYGAYIQSQGNYYN